MSCVNSMHDNSNIPYFSSNFALRTSHSSYLAIPTYIFAPMEPLTLCNIFRKVFRTAPPPPLLTTTTTTATTTATTTTTMSVASSGSVDEAIAFATEFAAGPLELSSSAEQVSEGIRRKIQEDFAGMNAARVEERANETRVDEEVRAASAQLQEESDRSSRVPSAVEALRARQKNSRKRH